MNRVFVLGAGFSKHISLGRFPVMGELARELRERFDWIASLTANVDFDLEKLLTWIDLFPWPMTVAGTPPNAEHSRNELKRYLAERLAIPPDDDWKLHSREFCRRLFRPNDVILTLNYDCLLEHLLWQERLWTPRGGYGGSPGLNDAASFGLDFESSPTVILKLHGSLNFELKTTGNDAYLSPFLDEGLFPGMATHWGNSPASPTLTLPTYAKVFGESRTMVHLWHEASDRLREARELIIIGYSMPRSDTLARLLMSFFRPDTSDSKQFPKVVILTNNDAESAHVWEQVYEVGGFVTSAFKPLLLAPASEEKYAELLAQTS